MYRSKKGFFLIELTIALVIIALISGGAIGIFSVKQERNRVKLTNARLDKIEEALKIHYKTEGYLPGPAKMNTKENAVDFGVAIKYGAAHSNDEEWTEVGGSKPEEKVLIGVAPTRSLGLPDEYMYDGWNQRIIYTVIKELIEGCTKFKNYSTTLTTGVIQIKDIFSTQVNPTNANKPVAYVLISHGKDGIGAINSVGEIKRACADPAGSLDNFDAENCNKTNPIFIYSKQIIDNIGKKSPDSKHYYDFVRWRQKAEFDAMEALFAANKCPLEHWSYVPEGLLPDGTKVPEFCIMTFNAKEHASKRVSGRKLVESRAKGRPKTSITFAEAKQRCDDLNTHYSTAGYKLITESQWLSVAGKIINIDENWSGGKVLKGKVKVGAAHYDRVEDGVSYDSSVVPSFGAINELDKLRISTDSKINKKEQYVWYLAGSAIELIQCDLGSLCDKATGMLYPDVDVLKHYMGNSNDRPLLQSYSPSVPEILRPVVNGTILTNQAGYFHDKRLDLDDLKSRIKPNCITRGSDPFNPCDGIKCCDAFDVTKCSSISKAGILSAHHIIKRSKYGIFGIITISPQLDYSRCSVTSYKGIGTTRVYAAHLNQKIVYLNSFRCTSPVG
jgi:hypothetical protein